MTPTRARPENSCGETDDCGSGMSLGRPAGAAPLDCGSRWFCVQAHARREPEAVRELGNQGFATCFPRFQVADDAHEAMFPGYLFVAFNPDADLWRPICSTRGVRRLFMTGTLRPVPVPHGVVEAFLLHPGGVIDKRPNALRLAMIPVGSRVRILAGPFADLSGVCSQTSQTSQARIGLLLETLAGRVTVTLPREIVEVD